MIEDVNSHNLADVLPLIRQYQEFYQVAAICDAHNRSFFAQFHRDNPAGCLFVYRVNGVAVAFATVYFCYSSTAAAKVGVMNDLFTLPAYRGQRIGHALIEHCLDFALSQQAVRLQWTTALDNERAQRLYDALPTSKKPWLFYTYAPKT